MTIRSSATVSRVLAALAATALAIGALLTYAEHTVFRSDAFADRVAASLRTAPVRDATARQLANAAVGIHPDLVSLRPIVDLAARAVVETPQFRSLVRRAALDVHRSAFEADRDTASLRVRDAGILLAGAVRRLRPDAADRVPTGVVTQVARIKGGINGVMLGVAERADGARTAKWIAFAAALVLTIAAIVLSDSRRASVLRLGIALAFVGSVIALASALGKSIVAGTVGPPYRDAVRAAAGVWLDPLVSWGLAGCGIGLVVALAAAAMLRPIPVAATLGRVRSAVLAPPRNQLERLLRVAVALALGGAMVAWPRTVLTIAIVALGVALVAAAVAEVVTVAAEPAPAAAATAHWSAPRVVRVGAVALVLAAGVAVVAGLTAGDGPAAAQVGRCNGAASLCDRRVNEVAFLTTHNAMAAADEPGWFFAAQDTGIPQQLEDGVRGFMLDLHYGISTPRGIATDLSAETQNHAKSIAQVGAKFVAAAERVRNRIGRDPAGERQVFLCHAFCEVGATKAVVALSAMHRFLVRHPEEVVVLSIEDDISAANTAAAIRSSGLVDEVYLGDAKRPWPTLRELIERDERVIVVTENHAGEETWIHRQPAVVQETPYQFKTIEALAAPESCKPNRGGTAGSLLLVNHWIDTAPAPRVTIARRVNAHDFLMRRLPECRESRGMMPNLVAVDFYRQGDAAKVVDELNDAR
jgi:hypothetical protein